MVTILYLDVKIYVMNKLIDARAQKISSTFKAKKINNFKNWQKTRSLNRPQEYFSLKRNGDLAELIGVVLGDGYLGQHERTQVLRIVSNSNNPQFVDRYTNLVTKIFATKPAVRRRKNANCVDIVLYQNNLAERLGLETGAKTHRVFTLPNWIGESTHYKKRFLRGLYETDGCIASHAKTYTHKFIFCNVNQSLLDTVFVLLCELGFHPVKTKTNVQLSRKTEVYKAAGLLKFREY